ncbi:MAG: ABC transporter ATP-binding protein [Thermoplasmata archaeon]|nr:ABC transporter ATP-binding protein [Thermoplasmata archaeon]
MIRIENVTKKWGDFALSNINLEVEKGEYFVVLGPTGAGKTLLLELIAGFHYPDRGKILIDGKDVTYLPPSQRGIGFVYQDYMLFPHMNVKDNIAFGLRMKGLKEEEIEERINLLAERCKIKGILNRYPQSLSGGERQRVALARALAVKPKILLLDEPLSALDAVIRTKIRKEIKDLHEKEGLTIIHVTHSREDAMLLADRMAILNEGKILQVGKPEEIFRKPEDKFVAEFVGVENIFHGKAERKGNITYFYSDGLKLISSMDVEDAKYASIRPEDIIISLNEIKSSARNCIKGKVTAIIDMGSLIRVEVNCGKNFIVYITRESFNELGIEIGKEVYLIFKAQNVNLFR